MEKMDSTTTCTAGGLDFPLQVRTKKTLQCMKRSGCSKMQGNRFEDN